MSVHLSAQCKINLFLRIQGIRPDGYHELHTLFLPVPSPQDVLTITETAEERLQLSCPAFPELESENNLLYKGWKSFAQATGYKPGMHIELEKNIPMGAGLGGGSADAGVLLRWLNKTAKEKALAPEALCKLGATLGADVPFFLQDAPCLATGIGEKLTPTDHGITGMTLLLVCPDVQVNTQWAYQKWDEMHKNLHKDAQDCLTTVETGNKNSLPVWQQNVFNDFERPVFTHYPELQAIKDQLLESGAAAAALSGSGSTVFGLFHHEHTAVEATNAFTAQEVTTYINRY